MANKCKLGHLVKASIWPLTTDQAGIIIAHDQLELHPFPCTSPVMLCVTGRQGDAGCEMWYMAA